MQTPRIILALVGATASGKTELALQLAQSLDLEIIGADSRQVYRGLDIGTAKPTPQQRALVPHHLIDHVEPAEDYQAWRFQNEFRALLPGLAQRGRIPLVTGGTGLYFRAALEGLSPAAPRSDELRAALQQELDSLGPEAMHRRLTEVDPVAAARIHVHDRVRIVRALEIAQTSGTTATEHLARNPAQPVEAPIVYLGIDWPRPQLHQRIERRTRQLLQNGWIEEVEGLLEAGVPVEARSMQSLGYREIVQRLQGKLSREDLVWNVNLQTRRYARRQLTWFRALPVHWLPADSPKLLELALERIRPALDHAR